jgi:hypothetical protein
MIPASFWQGLGSQLEAAKHGFLLLGEEQDRQLANAPFQLDYDWQLQGSGKPVRSSMPERSALDAHVADRRAPRRSACGV